MNLFHDNGHLTDEAFDALANGELDALGSLEVSEHLSFCDECLLQYTERLEDTELLSPPQPLQESVMKRIRRKAVTVLFSRYTTVAAAAVLAVALWNSGILERVGKNINDFAEPEPPAVTDIKEDDGSDKGSGAGLGRRMNEATWNVSNGLNSFFQNVFGSYGSDNEKAAPDNKAETGQTEEAKTDEAPQKPDNTPDRPDTTPTKPDGSNAGPSSRPGE